LGKKSVRKGGASQKGLSRTLLFCWCILKLRCTTKQHNPTTLIFSPLSINFWSCALLPGAKLGAKWGVVLASHTHPSPLLLRGEGVQPPCPPLSIMLPADEDVKFPPPLPRMDGGVGDGANYDRVDDNEDNKSHAGVKVEMHDASTDEDGNFPPPPSSREREKRRRVDGGGDGGANFDSVHDNGEESTLLSWVDGNIKSQGQECGGDNQRQEDEVSLSPSNGGMHPGGVDMQNLEEGSLPHTVGEQWGVQQSSIEGAPVESDADSVDHVLTEDYDVFDGSISFCCQNCR
jgi:hypothetical protein